LQKTTFRRLLHQWYQQHQRPLPWRQTNDPYRIWLSEIILQQTRVQQGLPYYERFVQNYPTVEALAGAPEDMVLKDWEGLGYYSRARNLQAAAQYIVEERKGHFPENYTELLQLKGVGTYTAAAVASFAYGEAQAVVDGNVQRVLSRLLGIAEPVNSAAGKKIFAEQAQDFLDPTTPAAYNQAIMEFGALQCRPRNPDCHHCPMQDFCVAFRQKRVAELPQKNKVRYQRARYFHYLLLFHQERVLVQKRDAGEIWTNLYQFPLLETHLPKGYPALCQEETWPIAQEKPWQLREEICLPPHKLSHQVLHLRLYLIDLEKTHTPPPQGGYSWVEQARLKELAFPRPLRQFIERRGLPLQTF